jgi:CRP-like cAMP-binding protein
MEAGPALVALANMTSSGERPERPRPVTGPNTPTPRATRTRPPAGAGTRSVGAVLARVPYFHSLSPADVRALERRGATRTVAQGGRVFTEGEPCLGLFVIIEGMVDVRQTSEAGREQSLHTEGSGAALGEVPLFDGGSYLASAVAAAPTQLLVLPRAVILALCRRRPAVALAFLETLAQRVRRVAMLAADLAFREVTERVARHLEAAARATGRPLAAGTAFELALTQEQLATRLGTVRELVARALARLRRSGIIAQHGRRVTILDPAQLATRARGRRDGGGQG